MASNQIAIRHQQQALTTTGPNDWEVLMSQARVLLSSGFLPQAIKTQAQAAAIIMQGRELNIGPMAALQMINVIQGKPTISPQLMMALINRTGELDDMKVTDDGKQCTVTLKRKDRAPFTTSFSMEEAAALGLAGKDNWKKQAKTMRQWRAIAAAARVVFPDAILGLYTPDEMGADTNEEGEIVTPIPPVQLMPAPEPSPIDVQAPLPSQQPAKQSRKEQYITRINEMWSDEIDEFGESDCNITDPLDSFSESELIDLGKTEKRRIENRRRAAQAETKEQ